MKAPGFWRKNGFLQEILLPFSVFYFFYLRIKSFFIKPEKLSVPIICVGNAVVGGAGKTPVAIAIAKLLRKKKVAFVSRGYKGKLKGPVKVDLNTHTVKEVGDEPFLLAKTAPCWVAKNRLEGAIAAIDDGAKILIFDDGLQNLSIIKDISILVIDSSYRFGNAMLFPAGPLRDRLDKTFSLSDCCVLLGEETDASFSDQLKSKLPVINAKFISSAKWAPEGKEFVAFAGIGQPEKFFLTLRQYGTNIVETVSFSDHYFFSKKDMRSLTEKAQKHGARLVTTEKDAVRLPQDFKENISVFPVEIAWQDEDKIKDLLSKI